MAIQFITIEKLLEMKENDESFTLVETLTTESFNKRHIPGAINIPLDQLEDQAENILKKNDRIVVYCASYTCQASTTAARQLDEAGYKHVMDFKGGKKLWEDVGYELE